MSRAFGTLDCTRKRWHNRAIMKRTHLKGEIIKLSELPRRPRNVVPKALKVLSALDVWPEAMRLMEEDKIAVGEAYTFVVPASEMEQHGIKTSKALARPIKKHLKDRYKGKYVVLTRGTPEGPRIIIGRPKR
jgi:hypothetical protein